MGRMAYRGSLPVGLLMALLVLCGCGDQQGQPAAPPAAEAGKTEEATEAAIVQQDPADSVHLWAELTEDQWRQRLSPEAFYVLRQKGTEVRYTGDYWSNKKLGSYGCAGCGTELFSSREKYDSGTGWPSFWAPADEKSVATAPDNSFFSRQTEVLCSKCDGHLGHVFDDGPAPSGLRYCINAVSLKFVEAPVKEGKEGKSEP